MTDFRNVILQRTFMFSVNVALFVRKVPYEFVNAKYIAQLIRCSSSVGANYRAVQRAKSTNDFINKLKIVEEEADESLFFMQLLREINPEMKTEIDPLINEGTELLKIVVAALKTTRARQTD